MQLLKLVKGFERHHLTQWPEHRKQMMPEHDVEKSVSKSNIEVIGPVINGLSKSVHVLQIGATVAEIVNMCMIAVLDAQCVEKRKKGEGCD